MNVSFNAFSSSFISIFKDNLSLAQTTQRNKIAVVALLVFAALAAYYVIKNCWVKENKIEKEEKKPLLSVPPASKGIKEKKTIDSGDGIRAIREGYFVDGRLQGPGRQEIVDDMRNEPEWKKTREKGEVSEDFTILKKVEEGNFKDGFLIEGTRTLENTVKEDDKIEIYKEIEKGNFRPTSLHGCLTGTRTIFKVNLPNEIQCVEKGIFHAKKLNGPGTITFSDGILHTGEFKEGKLVKGQGRIINQNDQTVILV